MFADGIAAFTAGAHQQTVEGLFHRDRFTGFDADVGITSPVDFDDYDEDEPEPDEGDGLSDEEQEDEEA